MDFSFLWSGLLSVTWQQAVMYVIGGLLIWLAIEKGLEPALLMPMGFGAILVNLPLSGVINQFSAGVGETRGIIQWLFETGIEASEAGAGFHFFMSALCAILRERPFCKERGLTRWKPF